MTKFQIILLVVFGIFIVVAVMVFSLSRNSSGGSATVTIWGDIPAYDFNTLANAANFSQDGTLDIRYVEKRRETISQEFTEAVAEERGPDLIILPLDELWQEKNKILEIPFQSVSERDFKSTFIEEGELFLTPTGMYALPLVIDPIVLYYNRDLLSRAGMAKPLAFWDEIYAATAKLTTKDPAGNLTKSTMALGEANNIPHHKEILSLLFLQAGTPITNYVDRGESQELRPELTSNFGLTTTPGISALDFYTQFSNPAKSFYSWNRSLVSAQTHFTSGDSAYYLGFASELRALRNKNPTLNVGVALVPQSRVSERSVTYGDLKGIAIARSTRNPSAALTAALKLISKDVSGKLGEIMVLPPVRRDLLTERQTDSMLSVFYDSALISRGWIDPDNQRTETVFRDMIESVTSGRARTSEAVSKANSELEKIIKQ